MTTHRTPDEWLAMPDFEGVKVLDPDGWDRDHLQVSWSESITRGVFESRLASSTCIFPAGYFDRYLSLDRARTADHGE